MFFKKDNYCYFVPAAIDGDYAIDNKGTEYVIESFDRTDYITTPDKQTWIIEYQTNNSTR